MSVKPKITVFTRTVISNSCAGPMTCRTMNSLQVEANGKFDILLGIATNDRLHSVNFIWCTFVPLQCVVILYHATG